MKRSVIEKLVEKGYNIRCIVQELELLELKLERNEFESEAEKERCIKGIFILKRMYMEVKSLRWTSSWKLKRIVTIFLRNNLDVRAVERECKICRNTAYNNICRANTLIEKHLKMKGFPTVRSIVEEVYNI